MKVQKTIIIGLLVTLSYESSLVSASATDAGSFTQSEKESNAQGRGVFYCPDCLVSFGSEAQVKKHLDEQHSFEVSTPHKPVRSLPALQKDGGATKKSSKKKAIRKVPKKARKKGVVDTTPEWVTRELLVTPEASQKAMEAVNSGEEGKRLREKLQTFRDLEIALGEDKLKVLREERMLEAYLANLDKVVEAYPYLDEKVTEEETKKLLQEKEKLSEALTVVREDVINQIAANVEKLEQLRREEEMVVMGWYTLEDDENEWDY